MCAAKLDRRDTPPAPPLWNAVNRSFKASRPLYNGRMNAKAKRDPTRADALAKLHTAMKMLNNGKAKLAIAHKQIDRAHKLIDESATALRESRTDRSR